MNTKTTTRTPDEISPQNYATAFGLVLSLGNIGAFLFPYIYSISVGYVGPRWSWMVLAVIAAVAWFGFFLAREPRIPHRTAAPHVREDTASYSLSR